MRDGTFEIAGHSVAVKTMGATDAQTAPLLYWIMMAAHGQSADSMAALIAERTATPFHLVAVNVNDWDHELSPWPAGNVTGQDDFTGEAPKFLSWLLWDAIPFVEGWEMPRDPIDRTSHDLMADARRSGGRVIGGYSMAGLFAAWALLKTRAFRGLACASGSLWYPGWLDWIAGRSAPADAITYLSLGTKEPRVKNPIVAGVGDATERTAALLAAADGGAHTFVWNPGGHFHEPNERMARAFAWVCDRMGEGQADDRS